MLFESFSLGLEFTFDGARYQHRERAGSRTECHLLVCHMRKVQLVTNSYHDSEMNSFSCIGGLYKVSRTPDFQYYYL